MANQTTITANKKLVEEFIRRVFNEHNGKLPRIISAVMCRGTEEPWERSGIRRHDQLFGNLFAALPDLHATTLSVVADEDTVWCRFVVEGTNEGSLFGFPATGKTVRWDEIDTYRLTNGKIAEEWSSPDMTNILYQVGAYTPPWIS